MEKGISDLINLKLLEKALGADLFENEKVSQLEGAKSINKKYNLKIFFFTLLFGLLFLPLRILFTFYEKHRPSSFSAYIVSSSANQLIIASVLGSSYSSKQMINRTKKLIATRLKFIQI